MPKTATPDQVKTFVDTYEGDIDAAIAALQAMQQQKRALSKNPQYKNNPVIIATQDLSKHYKVGRQKVDALRGISLKIHEGEFVAFTGPSGSGKSTLLQMIGGLDKPSRGSVVVNGQDLSKLSDRKLSRFRGQTVGFVFQFFYLQPFLNLQTNLGVPGIFSRMARSERQIRTADLAEAVGLAERLKHLPKELSGGQMQRAAIARALLNNPKIILADEPTGNLDSKNGETIIELFEAVRKRYGTTIVVVTHDPKIAARADREVALKDGKLAI